MNSPKKSLIKILTVQTQVAFNDNASKLVLVGLMQMVLPASESGMWVGVLAGLLVLPFILFAPVSGWLADRFAKKKVLLGALILQLAVILLLMTSIGMRNLHLAMAAFFLLAFQSCIFSPAKQGILKEIVGSEGLGVAVGWMELLTIAAILGGSFGGGLIFDYGTEWLNNPWHGALAGVGLLAFLCLTAWGIFLGTESKPAQSNDPFRASILWSHFKEVADLWKEKGLRLAALGTAYFYSLGGVLYLILLQIGREKYAGGVGSATESGILLCILGFGIVVGSLLAAGYSKQAKSIELGLIPAGGFGMAVTLIMLGIVPSNEVLFPVLLFLFGLTGGLFIVPLNAYLQDTAAEDRRGRVLASTNLLSNLGGIGAVGLQLLLAEKLNFTPNQQFLFLAIPNLLVALYIIKLLPESMLRLTLGLSGRLIYHVRTRGEENIPSGGALLVCNHVSYIDAIILQLGCPRPIRFIALENFFRVPILGMMLRFFQTIPISPRKAKEAIQTAAERIQAGELVCMFPEGELTRTGKLMGFKKGFELVARKANAPVLPVHLDSLWDSIFSFFGNRYFFKLPRKLPFPVTVSFGKPFSAEEANAMSVRQRILNSGEEAFHARKELDFSLGYALLLSLSKKPWRTLLIDRTSKRQSYSRASTLGAALALAKKWKREIPEKHVGIALPPGFGATVANLGVVLAGKIPANLNITAGQDAAFSSLNRAEIKTIISADLVKKRFKNFPWTEKTLDARAEIEACGKFNILKNIFLGCTVPARITARTLGLKRKGENQEAVLLFTSGSSGEPKGVMLSHRNILANTAQVGATNLMSRDDTILACLPLFHSFGLTMTLWYPLLHDCKFTTLPSPLDAKKIAETSKAENVSVLLGTPTFFRSYLRKLNDGELPKVRLAVAGAEKLPADLVENYQKKFGIFLLEGYGITETAPVASVNVPNPAIGLGTNSEQIGWRIGTAGRLLPGMTARITDPDTREELPLNTLGMLELRGANIFMGYLKDEKRTQDVLKDGWFITGDLGRFDEDGFLHLEGRLSRFSKIGGEMVPHGVVEIKIMEIFNLTSDGAQPVVVTGIPDEAKGEALVMLTTEQLSLEKIRKGLNEAGLPNLWIPKNIVQVQEIPLLGTGKLDLSKCKTMAMETATAS